MSLIAQWIFATMLMSTNPVSAGTLEVGADKAYLSFAEAVKNAQDGDEILIAPGEYYECAIIRQNNLKIAGDLIP